MARVVPRLPLGFHYPSLLSSHPVDFLAENCQGSQSRQSFFLVDVPLNASCSEHRLDHSISSVLNGCAFCYECGHMSSKHAHTRRMNMSGLKCEWLFVEAPNNLYRAVATMQLTSNKAINNTKLIYIQYTKQFNE